MKTAGLLFALLAIYGCSAKPYVIEPDINADRSRTTRLYVVGHGWHVGLALAADELNPAIPGFKARFEGAQYYELGWGDEGFYQAREITSGVTLQAIIWSRGAVMHVAALPVSPDRYFHGSDVVDTCLNADEADALTRFLSSSFSHGVANQLIELKRGIYGDSQFYEAEGRYHLLNTSNKWAAKALKSAGMEISPTLKLTAGSVMEFVRANRKACTR